MDVAGSHPATTVRISGSDAVYRCAEGATVLQALSPVHHRMIRSGCHGGGCGVCRIRILAGDYLARGMSRAHVTVADEADRITLACRTWPRSALVVEPLGKLTSRLTRSVPTPSQQDSRQRLVVREKKS